MKTEISKGEIFRNDPIRLIDPISRVQVLANDGGVLSNKKKSDTGTMSLFMTPP